MVVAGESVVERFANPGFDKIFAVNRQRMPQVVRKQPHIVQAVHMVGMIVRIEHRVDHADLLAQQLSAQVGRGIDQQISLGQAQHQ